MTTTTTNNNNVIWTHYKALGPEYMLDTGMTKEFSTVSEAKSAGCSRSSQISEALSAELLSRLFGLTVTHSEMELAYRSSASSRLDFRCARAPRTNTTENNIITHSGGIAVSVTRAVAPSALADRQRCYYQQGGTWGGPHRKGENKQKNDHPQGFSREDARRLLCKKLRALRSARRNIVPSMAFDRAILHVWCASERIAQVVQAEAAMLDLNLNDNDECREEMSASSISDGAVLLLLTLTEFGSKLRYSYIYGIC